jgi:hypothetical protein
MDTDPQGSDPFDALIDAIEPDPEEATVEDGEAEPEETPEDQQEPEEAAEKAPAVDEIEFDGKKLAIPKGTPPELVESVKSLANDLKADYTRKTQEVAEQRKSVATRSEAIQQQEQMLSANFTKAVEYKALQDRMAQFENIDWQALVDENPAQATKLNLAYQGLQRQAGTMYRELQQSEAQRQQALSQHQQSLVEAGQRELAKRIPKWSGDVAKSVSETALSYGFSQEELSSILDPRIVHAMHDAMQFRKLQASKPAAMQKVAQAPKVLKPGAVAARSPNQAAVERLKKHGRLDDFAKLL